MAGEPCILATRLTTASVWALRHSRGLSDLEIAELYPGIDVEQIADAAALEKRLRPVPAAAWLLARRRWLLDQNFPKPRFHADQLDARVQYIHLYDFNPSFSRTSTPDWLLHLAADDAGFDAVVITDPEPA